MKHQKITKIEEWITTWWGMWLVFFICTAALAVFVQLIVLPHFLPNMHYGHGLFVPDSTGFHQVAQDQAKTIMDGGWKEWKLKPENFYPAGIASLFYYLWYPEPFALIPFNAVLHATSGCLVFFLLSSFIRNRLAALGGAALFVLNPASLEWTSQIHRDGTFILGNLLLLSAWLVLSRAVVTGKWPNYLYSLLFTFVGTVCIWAARPYWIQVVIAATISIIVVFLFVLVMTGFKKSSGKYYHVVAIFMGILMLAMQVPFIDKDTSFTERFEAEKVNVKSAGADQIETSKDKIITMGEFKGRLVIEGLSEDRAITQELSEDRAITQGLSEDRAITQGLSEGRAITQGLSEDKAITQELSEDRAITRGLSEGRAITQRPFNCIQITEGKFTGAMIPLTIIWNPSPLIPDFIESKLYGMATYRLGSTFSSGKSLIDPEIQFNSLTSYLLYLPRAIQVGFLSPFPSLWIEPGKTPGTSVGRIVLGIVTVFFYLCLAFFILSLMTYGKNHEYWLIVLYSTYGLLVFTYAYPNIGTFLRLRYGFFMVIVSIGFAFAVQKFIESKQKKYDGHS